MDGASYYKGIFCATHDYSGNVDLSEGQPCILQRKLRNETSFY